MAISVFLRCLDENHAVCVLVDNCYVTEKGEAWHAGSHGKQRHAAFSTLSSFVASHQGTTPSLQPLWESSSKLHVLLDYLHHDTETDMLFHSFVSTVRKAAASTSAFVVLHVVTDRSFAARFQQHAAWWRELADEDPALGARVLFGSIVGARNVFGPAGGWQHLRAYVSKLRSGSSAHDARSQSQGQQQGQVKLDELPMLMENLCASGTPIDLCPPFVATEGRIFPHERLLLCTLNVHRFRHLWLSLTHPQVSHAAFCVLCFTCLLYSFFPLASLKSFHPPFRPPFSITSSLSVFP